MSKLTDEFLYGKGVEVPHIDPLVIVRRIELLNENLEELMEVQYLARDWSRVNAIIKAKTFWDKFDGK